MNGEQLTSENFRRAWRKVANLGDLPAARAQVMEALIARTLRLQKAREMGLEDDPIVRDAYESLLIARLNETLLRPQLESVTVGDDELRERYEQVRDSRFATGERARVAVLWLDTRGQGPLEARYTSKLEKVRRAMIDGEATLGEMHFGTLSISNSEHRASRYRGGELGWLELGTTAGDAWRDTVIEIASGLPAVGDLSEVELRPGGAFLVRLMGRAPSRQRPFDEVSDRLRQELISEKRTAVREAYDASFESDDVAINQQNLMGITDLPAGCDPVTATNMEVPLPVITP